jgi:predicted signal transduction protein with EAL and GGDEF domain
VGVAVFPDDAPDHHELILRADEALYQAKRAGKARAVLARAREGSPSKSRSASAC